MVVDLEEPIINLENYTISLEEAQANKNILENLKLLGWEDSQLMDELLSLHTMIRLKANT
jgi:hypothetical protein